MHGETDYGNCFLWCYVIGPKIHPLMHPFMFLKYGPFVWCLDVVLNLFVCSLYFFYFISILRSVFKFLYKQWPADYEGYVSSYWNINQKWWWLVWRPENRPKNVLNFQTKRYTYTLAWLMGHFRTKINVWITESSVQNLDGEGTQYEHIQHWKKIGWGITWLFRMRSKLDCEDSDDTGSLNLSRSFFGPVAIISYLFLEAQDLKACLL